MFNSFHIVVANKCIFEILWPNSEVTCTFSFQLLTSRLLSHILDILKKGENHKDVLESSVVLRF